MLIVFKNLSYDRAGARNYQRDGPMTVSGNQVTKIMTIKS